MKADVVFNGLADEFERDIYKSSKGYIRLNVLWHDLIKELPDLQKGNYRILDVGGGMGQITCKLAALGHHVVLCDPSTEMLAKAELNLRAQGLEGRVTLIECGIQQLPHRVSGQFDVILCHAVLEWLGAPQEALVSLRPFLSPHGQLSLMYFNRNATIVTALLAGHLSVAWAFLEGNMSSVDDVGRATPLDPQVVSRWLSEAGYQMTHQAGIRVFHDHMPAACKEGPALETLLMTEKRLSTTEPFNSLGQHIHVICQLRNSAKSFACSTH